MNLENVSKQLEALGNTTRLEICQILVKNGGKGINVSEINKLIPIPPSTLSHHLAKLVNAGLVSQLRAGRELLCHSQTDAMDGLVLYLADNCCSDDSEIWG